jgi:multiple sugar transport system ATP-binding protein
MAEVRLEKLAKRFGHVEAVRSVDLAIPDAKVTVLVGPSGCGKTTTLRLIAGLEEATTGRVLIDGRDVTGLEPKERDLAMVFQNYALYPHMSVRDNISFGLRAKRLPAAEIERRVSEAVRMLGVEELMRRKPAALSGGQQQRVAIGRAIVREPAAFLFDEPLSNLDAKLRTEMRTEILRLQRGLRATVVHVTHDQEEAMTLADQVVVMNGGEVVQIGQPADVYQRPATEFVGRFIGSPEMNVLSLKEARAALSLNGMSLPGHDDLRLGMRPEDVKLASEVPDSGPGPRFTARVALVELLGAQASVTLELESAPELRALVDAGALSSLTEGAEAHFAVSRDAVHFFVGLDGKRVDSA